MDDGSELGSATRTLFAYGALLDRSLMQRRCKRPAIVGAARAEGYRFTINSSGVATLLNDPGAIVHGLLWRLSPADQASLDIYEGVDQGLYEKRQIQVCAGDDKIWSVLVYIAAESRVGKPRPGYLERIISAAGDLGFPDQYVEELMSWRLGVQRGGRTPSSSAR